MPRTPTGTLTERRWNGSNMDMCGRDEIFFNWFTETLGYGPSVDDDDEVMLNVLRCRLTY